jgi:hypothetical protein
MGYSSYPNQKHECEEQSMTTMTMEKQKVIVNNPWNTERKEFPYLNTLEDMEASELFEEFQERIREWKRTRYYMDLRTCAGEFRTVARENGYNLSADAAVMFIDIYWELV